MTFRHTPVLILCIVITSLLPRDSQAQSDQSRKEARQLLSPHGLERFPPLLIRALETWLDVEDRYWKGDYKSCKKVLDSLWNDFPPGHKAWGRSRSRVRDVFLGRYPCYYALRMLTTCVDWRLSLDDKPSTSSQAVLGVILVGKSRGMQPRNLDELSKGEGVEVDHSLDASILAGDNRIVRQSTRLFREYVFAITKGKLAVKLRFLPLPDLEIPVTTISSPRRHAGIKAGGMHQVWAAIPDSTRAQIDWWWVVYPSHVPDKYEDFEKTEFITGGMGVGPDGSSPCFISDDLWLVRKPPHLGKGNYTEIERRAYLPHWLQHEFFHHLYRTWPEFDLEKKGHQWFNRASWPKDFVGAFEPDYYYQSLVKRLQTRAKPALHIGLRYNQPDEKTLNKIKIESLLGSYVHKPVQNKWHRGTITRVNHKRGNPVLRWRNDAGVSWKLYPELRKGILRTGVKNPYFKGNPTSGRTFRIILQRDASGNYTPTLVGFSFQSTLYRRQGR